MTTALGAQVGQYRLRHPQRTEHVRIELSAHVVFSKLLNKTENTEAGVVDDDIQPPEVLVRFPHRCGYGSFVGESLIAVAVMGLTRQPEAPEQRLIEFWW